LAREANEPSLTPLLRDLDRACYVGGQWSGQALAGALHDLPAGLQIRADAHSTEHLAPLYPYTARQPPFSPGFERRPGLRHISANRSPGWTFTLPAIEQRWHALRMNASRDHHHTAGSDPDCADPHDEHATHAHAGTAVTHHPGGPHSHGPHSHG